jgi:hypothetical protein
MSIVNKFTVRRAEITVAVVLALCSIALMTNNEHSKQI